MVSLRDTQVGPHPSVAAIPVNARAQRDPTVSFVDASGDPSDLAVLVARGADAAPLLYAIAARRWVRPASIPRASSVSSLARLDDESWLVTGRSSETGGFVLRYRPLMWQVERAAAPKARAYLASAGQPELALSVVVGSQGNTVRLDGDELLSSVVDGDPDLSAVGLDAAGRAWAASLGKLWLQRPDDPVWTQVWTDANWQVPFISVFADIGRVIAMTADGGILEGRLETVGGGH
ncbi:MAG: hypothetical protein KF718_33765 [Polyangiaceae bacterium]|nr:hypothetical protein [Polyangiaceae bacterium]